VLPQVLVLYDAADTMMTDLPSFLQPAVKHVLVPVARALGFKARYPSHSSAAAPATPAAAAQQKPAVAAAPEDADAATAEAELQQALQGSGFAGKEEL
jgi:hypothetical protein